MLSTSPKLPGNGFASARGTRQAFLACQRCDERRYGRLPQLCTCARHEILDCLPIGHERCWSVLRSRPLPCHEDRSGPLRWSRGSTICGHEDVCLRRGCPYLSRKGTQGPASKVGTASLPHRK